MFRVFLIALITSLRPLLGPSGCCRYTLTCTRYAQIILKDLPLYKSIPLIIRRVTSCNPFTRILQRGPRKRLFKHRSRES